MFGVETALQVFTLGLVPSAFSGTSARELAICNAWSICLFNICIQDASALHLQPCMSGLYSCLEPALCAKPICLRRAHNQSLSYLNELTLKSICPPLYVPRFFLVFSCRKSFPRTYTPLQDQAGSSRMPMNAFRVVQCIDASSMTAGMHKP